jgi:hypothetical protein
LLSVIEDQMGSARKTPEREAVENQNLVSTLLNHHVDLSTFSAFTCWNFCS